MENLLTFHEAVAVILLGEPGISATFEEIASEIERRNLFLQRREVSL